MKKNILLAVTLWSTVSGIGIIPLPHPSQTGKQYRIGKGLGTIFGAIGTVAELNALHLEALLKKVDRMIDLNEKLYRKSQGTKKEMSQKRFERRQKKYQRQRERILAELRRSERTAHVGLVGQELAAVRNNWAERPLGAVAQGLGWNMPAAPGIFGKLLPLRYILALLDGVLSIARHFSYKSPQHFAWLTAAQRTSRLMKMVLRNGLKGMPKRVLVSYALQLIGVGMSFVGNVRHNLMKSPYIRRDGALIDGNGHVIFEADGSVGNMQLWWGVPHNIRQQLSALASGGEGPVARRLAHLQEEEQPQNLYGYDHDHLGDHALHNDVQDATSGFHRAADGNVIFNHRRIHQVAMPEPEGGEERGQCAICLEEYVRSDAEPFGDVIINPACGHRLHYACVQPIKPLFNNAPIPCPICRQDIARFKSKPRRAVYGQIDPQDDSSESEDDDSSDDDSER